MKLHEVAHDEPIILSMLQKVLDSGARVKLVLSKDAYYFGHIRRITDADGALKKVQFVNYGNMRPGVTVVGEKTVVNLSRMKLKKQDEKAPDGKELWHLFDPKYVKDGDSVKEDVDHSKPIILTQIDKLLAAGHKVGTFWYDGDGDSHEAEVTGTLVDSSGEPLLRVSVYKRWLHDWAEEEVYLDSGSTWKLVRLGDKEWSVEDQ